MFSEGVIHVDGITILSTPVHLRSLVLLLVASGDGDTLLPSLATKSGGGRTLQMGVSRDVYYNDS